MVKNTYSPCHKDACVQISIGNTEWLLRYKGVSYTCFRGEKASFHREFWLGETPLGPSSRPRIWGEWPEIWHADVSCITTLKLIRFWSWSVDFPHFCRVRPMAPCLSDWPLDQSFSQSVSQSASQPASQSVSQSVSQSWCPLLMVGASMQPRDPPLLTWINPSIDK